MHAQFIPSSQPLSDSFARLHENITASDSYLVSSHKDLGRVIFMNDADSAVPGTLALLMVHLAVAARMMTWVLTNIRMMKTRMRREAVAVGMKKCRGDGPRAHRLPAKTSSWRNALKYVSQARNTIKLNNTIQTWNEEEMIRKKSTESRPCSFNHEAGIDVFEIIDSVSKRFLTLDAICKGVADVQVSVERKSECSSPSFHTSLQAFVCDCWIGNIRTNQQTGTTR